MQSTKQPTQEENDLYTRKICEVCKLSLKLDSNKVKNGLLKY